MRAIPPGSTVISIPGGRRILYPQAGERLEVDAAQYAKRDSRGERIVSLEAALRAIRSLALDVDALDSVEPAVILETVALLADNALTENVAEPERSMVFAIETPAY